MTRMKENNGKAARRKQLRKLLIVFASCFAIILIFETGGWSRKTIVDIRRNSSSLRSSAGSNTSRSKVVNDDDFKIPSDVTTDDEKLKLIVSGAVTLTDIQVSDFDALRREGSSYGGINGIFCRLDWYKHKSDPNKYPMFRDLNQHSEQCTHDKTIIMDLKLAVTKSKEYDNMDSTTKEQTDYDLKFRNPPHTLKPNGFVFHESRCGSTLVANSLASFNPEKTRVFSESPPPVTAMKICGLGGKQCPPHRAAEIMRDVVYMMGRTDDENEEYLFFKIQSISSKYIDVALDAFPDVPWIYVYRDPVQVMMSHLSVGLNRANCVNQIRPHEIPDISLHFMKELDITFQDLTPHEKCALHLSTLCDSAVQSLNQSHMGKAVNYDGLVNTLVNDIIPNHFSVPFGKIEKQNVLDISSRYSKGRDNRDQEWKSDSEEKEKNASALVKDAAELLLYPSYAKLEKLK